jgi:hypothetical protein
MNLKLTFTILAIAVVPVCAQGQQPSGAKVKADAQNVVKIISGDKAKTQTYCQMDQIGDQIDEAAQKKDNKKAEELSRKMEELSGRLGPEYVAFVKELENVDPNSQDTQQINSIMGTLDKLCAH